MEGLLHPVGPENERTYWLRRAVAVLVLVALIAGLGFMISAIGGDEAEVAAEPAPAAAPPAGEPTPAGPATADPDAQPAAEPPPADPPATDETLPPEPANTFHESAAPAPSAENAAPAACEASAMRVRVGGPRQVQADVPVMLGLNVSNASDAECAVTINADTFELRVFSGSDRIWSSRDCVAGLAPRDAVLAPGGSLDWEMEWRANRSAPQCQTAKGRLAAGTYVATAQLTEAQPAQHVMQVRS